MPGDRPNILWLMTDEQRTDSLGCAGSPWARTPHLDRLANEGVRFERAITPGPVCVPARLSILTGKLPHETGVWWNHGSGPARHLTESFREAGYVTVHFGRSHYMTPNNAFEFESQTPMPDIVGCTDWPEDRYAPRDHEVVQYPGPDRGGVYPWVFAGRWPADPEARMEAQTVRDAVEWIEDYDGAAPFLLRVGFLMPHTPVVPPAPYDRLIPDEAIVLPPPSFGLRPDAPRWIRESLFRTSSADRLTADQQRIMRRHYYGQVAHLDFLFGRVLEALERRGILDHTIVVFVSDHGTHLADYGLVQKQTFYEPVVNVPYFFWNPRYIASGRCLGTPVETRGLLPTLMELAGLDVPAPLGECVVTEALRRGVEPPARHVFSEFTLGSFDCRPNDRLVMVRDGDWKLTVCLEDPSLDGSLHHLATDPFEARNRFADPACAGVRDRLLDALRRRLGESGEAR